MTWRDKNGPVFRLSPDSAWPLGRDSRSKPEGPKPCVDRGSVEDESDGAAKTAIAQKPHLKVVSK